MAAGATGGEHERHDQQVVRDGCEHDQHSDATWVGPVPDDAADQSDQAQQGASCHEHPLEPSHRTTNRVTHLVCNTPGRFGAISRNG